MGEARNHPISKCKPPPGTVAPPSGRCSPPFLASPIPARGCSIPTSPPSPPSPSGPPPPLPPCGGLPPLGSSSSPDTSYIPKRLVSAHAFREIVRCRCSPRRLDRRRCLGDLPHIIIRSRELLLLFSSHSFWTSSSLYVPAGVTQGEGHTGFIIHLSAVHALTFLARRIQLFLSLVDREVEFCVLTI